MEEKEFANKGYDWDDAYRPSGHPTWKSFVDAATLTGRRLLSPKLPLKPFIAAGLTITFPDKDKEEKPFVLSPTRIGSTPRGYSYPLFVRCVFGAAAEEISSLVAEINNTNTPFWKRCKLAHKARGQKLYLKAGYPSLALWGVDALGFKSSYAEDLANRYRTLDYMVEQAGISEDLLPSKTVQFNPFGAKTLLSYKERADTWLHVLAVFKVRTSDDVHNLKTSKLVKEIEKFIAPLLEENKLRAEAIKAFSPKLFNLLFNTVFDYPVTSFDRSTVVIPAHEKILKSKTFEDYILGGNKIITVAQPAATSLANLMRDSGLFSNGLFTIEGGAEAVAEATPDPANLHNPAALQAPQYPVVVEHPTAPFKSIRVDFKSGELTVVASDDTIHDYDIKPRQA